MTRRPLHPRRTTDALPIACAWVVWFGLLALCYEMSRFL